MNITAMSVFRRGSQPRRRGWGFTTCVVIVMATALVLGGTSVIAPAVSKAEPVTSCGDAEIVGVRVSFYPWVDKGYPSLRSNGLIADYGLLDAFAREYANNPHPTNTGGMSRSDADVQNFFVWWMLNRLAGIAAGIDGAPGGYDLNLSTSEGVGRAQWLAHISGYYASVWLRTNMRTFDHALPPVVADDGVYSSLYTEILNAARNAALYGTDTDAIGFSEHALRTNVPVPARPLGPLNAALKISPADAGMFGYDAGWLNYLLPPSTNSPTNAKPFTASFFTADTTKLLDAHFALAEQPFLVEAQRAYAAAESMGGETRTRLDQTIDGAPGEEPLLAYQQRYHLAATALYATGVPGGFGTVYRGWNQPQYDRLLTWASYAVMVNKTNTLNAITAVATRDPVRARQQINGSMLWWVYCLTYIAAIFDPRSDALPLDDSLPKFVTTDGGTCQ